MRGRLWKRESPGVARKRREFRWFAVGVLAVFVFCGLFGGLVAPVDPLRTNLLEALRPPAFSHLLGTDQLGRDVLSRVIVGARVSLVIGVSAVGSATLIGVTVALCCYFGGLVDAILMRVTDVILSVPFILLALALAGILGPGVLNLTVALVFILWTFFARVLRSEVIRLKEADFVRLAKVAGASPLRILGKHILPSIMNTTVVLATLYLGTTIITEAALSFLGLGVPPPAPAWGSMLADGKDVMVTSWWVALFPGFAILLVVLSTNILGDWLRERLDPKRRQLLL